MCCSLKRLLCLCSIYIIVLVLLTTTLDMITLMGLNTPDLILINENLEENQVITDSSVQINVARSVDAESLAKYDLQAQNYSQEKTLPVKEKNIILAIIRCWDSLIHQLENHSDKLSLNIILLTKLLLRLLTMITLPFLIVGNRTDKKSYIVPYKIVHFILYFYSLSVSIYFFITYIDYKYIQNFTWVQDFFLNPSEENSKKFVDFYLLFVLSDSSLVVLFLNLVLNFLITARYKQIKNKKKLEAQQGNWNVELQPFNLPRAKANDEISPINSHFNQPINHNTTNINHYPLNNDNRMATSEEINVNTTPFSYTNKSGIEQTPHSSQSYYDNHAFSKN